VAQLIQTGIEQRTNAVRSIKWHYLIQAFRTPYAVALLTVLCSALFLLLSSMVSLSPGRHLLSVSCEKSQVLFHAGMSVTRQSNCRVMGQSQNLDNGRHRSEL